RHSTISRSHRDVSVPASPNNKSVACQIDFLDFSCLPDPKGISTAKPPPHLLRFAKHSDGRCRPVGQVGNLRRVGNPPPGGCKCPPTAGCQPARRIPSCPTKAHRG